MPKHADLFYQWGCRCRALQHQRIDRCALVVAAPNYEAPTDSDANNTYQVVVRVSDGTLADEQTITVSVTDANDVSPVFSSGSTANAAENSTAAYTASATDADSSPANKTLSYSLGAGGDNALFNIDPSSGGRHLQDRPEFRKSPSDAGANGVYDITVKVTDGVHAVSQNVAITVTNINEAPVITSNGVRSNRRTHHWRERQRGNDGDRERSRCRHDTYLFSQWRC